MRGRKAKPDAIKKLTGTFDKKLSNGLEVRDKITVLPPAPKYFGTTAKKIWKDVGEQCRLLGILNQGNLTPLVAYCSEMSTYLDLTQEINKEGLIQIVYTEYGDKKVANPKKQIASNCLRNAIKLAQEYGLTPATINKIGISGKKDEDEYISYKNRR